MEFFLKQIKKWILRRPSQPDSAVADRAFFTRLTLSLLLTSPPSFLTPPLFQGFSPNFSPEVDRPGSLPFSGVPFLHRRALLMDADGGAGATDVVRAIAAALDWRSPPETRNAAVAFLESVSSISSTLCAYEEGKGGNPNCYGRRCCCCGCPFLLSNVGGAVSAGRIMRLWTPLDWLETLICVVVFRKLRAINGETPCDLWKMCVGIEGYAIAGYIMHICNTFRLITEKKNYLLDFVWWLRARNSECDLWLTVSCGSLARLYVCTALLFFEVHGNAVGSSSRLITRKNIIVIAC